MEANRELSDFKLVKSDWDFLEGIGMVLFVSSHPDPSLYTQLAFQCARRIQQMMLAGSQPVLSSAIGIFEIFISQWKELSQDHKHLTPIIKSGFEWVEKFYQEMGRTNTYIVTRGEFLTVSHHELNADLSCSPQSLYSLSEDCRPVGERRPQ
jgi:hypothetical protein